MIRSSVTVWAVAVASLCAGLILLDRQATEWWPQENPLDRNIRTPAAALTILSLGMQPLVADYLWIDAVQYYGHTLGEHVHGIVDGKIVEIGLAGEDVPAASKVFYSLVKRLMEVDPFFVRPVLLGAMYLIDPHSDPLVGLRLLEDGARNRPDSWQLRLWHGFYRFAILEDKATALAEMTAAAACPGCPEYVPSVRQFMETAPDSVVARVFFTRAYDEARTAAERAYFLQRLEELDAGIDAFDVGHGRMHEHDDPHDGKIDAHVE